MPTSHDALHALRAPDQRYQGRALTADVGEITAEGLTAIEAFAVTVRAWNPTIIPGLLQTTRYAAATIAAARPSLPRTEIARYAHGRAARVDQFLDRWGNHPAAGDAWFVIGEEAITTPLAHDQAHRAQLEQLRNLAELPRIHIRVMPAGRPVPGRAGQLSLYGLEPAEEGRSHGVRVGYLETPVGGWYTTRSADVARLHTTFSAIIDTALDRGATLALLKEYLAA